MAQSKLPNLIIFISDSWRGKDVGCLGNEVIRTPNAVALAGEGVAFSNCFVQNTVCTPSRCSFMSGRYPHVKGHRVQEHKLVVADGDPVILKELKDKGYYVWCNGIGPVQCEDISECCSELFVPEPGSYQPYSGPVMDAEHRLFYSFYRGKAGDEPMVTRDDAIVQGAINFLNSKPQEPFCLFINLAAPHPPFRVEEPYFSMYDRDKLPPIIPQPEPGTKSAFLDKVRDRMGLDRLSEGELKEILAVYYGMITKVDASLGRLTEAVRLNGYWDDSAVFLFSDHGEYAGDYRMVEKSQNNFDDSLSKVPLIIKYPSSISIPIRERPVDALVEMLDFYATVAELAELPNRHTTFSKSLVPVSQGLADEHREVVFCEGGALAYEPHTHEPNGLKPGAQYWPRVGAQNDYPELHGKVVMARTKTFKYVKRLYERDELYDLTKDPDELHNLIEDEDYEGVRQELLERLVDWYMETADAVPFPNKLNPEGMK
ncbi:sulfatase-like hydrolase/transferase [Paenibacillus filicis]|uniref:Sulfatase-like hydrolase/transferase n=1 Tax=Paenibacillus gyeongsangnamensis TaxID=3388067 RepID=A0ABT4Q4A7_9BACL|nr:sulfatase-like hydrolase/transferase [Paenibacillus filicis]MCZ8511714.1 sulfatase-like hydrolase/transferase [Paenibacillus filicis]